MRTLVITGVINLCKQLVCTLWQCSFCLCYGENIQHWMRKYEISYEIWYTYVLFFSLWVVRWRWLIYHSCWIMNQWWSCI